MDDGDRAHLPEVEKLAANWGITVLTMDRMFGVIVVATGLGWVFTEKPSTDQRGIVVGKHTSTEGGFEDVVLIDVTVTPPEASGARFRLGDAGQRGAVPIRAVITGAPDKVLAELLEWADE